MFRAAPGLTGPPNFLSRALRRARDKKLCDFERFYFFSLFGPASLPLFEFEKRWRTETPRIAVMGVLNVLRAVLGHNVAVALLAFRRLQNCTL